MSDRGKTDTPWLVRFGGLVTELPFSEETADVEKAIAYLHEHYPQTRGVPVDGIYRPRTYVCDLGSAGPYR